MILVEYSKLKPASVGFNPTIQGEGRQNYDMGASSLPNVVGGGRGIREL